MFNDFTHIERMTVHLQTLGAVWFLLLAVIAVAGAIWYYRDTTPPVLPPIRYLFVGLRAVVLLLLLLSLSEPVVNLVRSVNRVEKIAILLDTSSSMSARQDPDRARRADKVVGELRTVLGRHGVYLTFDSSTGEYIYPPAFTGAATDIAGAVELAVTAYMPSSVVLVTDGRWNLGADPAGTSMTDEVPVHTVVVGEEPDGPDVVLDRVSAPAIGYDGDTIDVDVYVRASRASDEEITVEIREDGGTIVQDNVTLGEGRTGRVRLQLPLSDPGVHRFEASLTVPFEEPRENNRRLFDVRVVKSAFRLLIIADAPDPDLAFLKRVIESSDDFSTVSVISAGASSPLSSEMPDTFDEFDAILLINGGGIVSGPLSESLRNAVTEGAGLLFLGSTLPDGGPLVDILPLSDQSGVRDGEYYVGIARNGLTHFITAGMLGDYTGTLTGFLPPIHRIHAVTPLPDSSRVLLRARSADGTENLPVLIIGRYGAGKVVALPVSGIWRWKLMLEGAERETGMYSNLVLGTLRWLTSETDESPLAIKTGRRTYLSGEDIVFDARLFDNVFSPVSGADIAVNIDGGSGKLMLEERERTVYTGVYRGAAPGKHAYRAVAYVDNHPAAVAVGEFVVQDVSLEMLDSSPDFATMNYLSAHTGGLSVTPAGIDSLAGLLKPSYRHERLEENRYLALNPLMPLLAVVLLAIEWWLRKRRGMI